MYLCVCVGTTAAGCTNQPVAIAQKIAPIQLPSPPSLCLPIDSQASLLALTTSLDSPCPWFLLEKKTELLLTQPTTKAFSSVGKKPLTCQHTSCYWQIADTQLGPTVLAIAPSRESELSHELWFAAPLGKTKFDFVPLLLRDTTQVDFTDIGSAFILRPFVCELSLVLLASPRVLLGKQEEIPTIIKNYEGVYENIDGSLSFVQSNEQIAYQDCQAIDFDFF